MIDNIIGIIGGLLLVLGCLRMFLIRLNKENTNRILSSFTISVIGVFIVVLVLSFKTLGM